MVWLCLVLNSIFALGVSRCPFVPIRVQLASGMESPFFPSHLYSGGSSGLGWERVRNIQSAARSNIVWRYVVHRWSFCMVNHLESATQMPVRTQIRWHLKLFHTCVNKVVFVTSLVTSILKLEDWKSFKVLSDAGFRDIQDIALERWGQQVQMTCKHKTRKDFFFISRELAPFLTGVTVDHTVWSDHAVLQGFFCCGPSHITRHLWRQPRPVEWPLIWRLLLFWIWCRVWPLHWNTPRCGKKLNPQAVTPGLLQGKPPFSRKQLGRGSTLETKIVKRSFHHGPVKPGRVTDIQPLFAGLSQQHAHWFRQLRRLQSFVNFRKVHQTDTPTGHGVALWSSIIRAKGFDDTFVQWWKQHSSRVFGAPNHLPMDPPEFEVAQKDLWVLPHRCS